MGHENNSYVANPLIAKVNTQLDIYTCKLYNISSYIKECINMLATNVIILYFVNNLNTCISNITVRCTKLLHVVTSMFMHSLM